MQTPVPIVLITGFLGSGKTTLIKQLLKELDGITKIGIIQNEFAPANTDAEEIHRSASGNYQLVELNNGSIFCVCLLGSFLKSLHEFVNQYQPELVLIEASGLADPIAVGEIFNYPNSKRITSAPLCYLKGSIVVVDAKHFLKLSNFQRQLRNQVRIADDIILNKIDCIDEPSTVISQIRLLNPNAKIHLSTFCQVDWNTLLNANGEAISLSEILEKTSINREENQSPSGRPANLKSTVFRTGQLLHPDRLNDFVKSLAGKTLRAKGTVACADSHSFQVHSVFGDFSISPISELSGKSLLVTISESLTHRELEELYLKHI